MAAAMTAAVPATVAFADSSGDMAMGGGQFMLDFDPGPPADRGAFNTIAFTARQVGPDGEAEGEVQEVDRTRSGGPDPVYHGRVFCMKAEGDIAVIAYRPRQENAPTNEVHQLYVQDNGDGPLDDVIVLDRHLAQPQVPCELPTPSPEPPTLGRGNVTVVDGD